VGISTVSAVNVGENIMPLTTNLVQLHSKLAIKKEMLMVTEWVGVALQGPKSITPPNVIALRKHKVSTLIDAPHYHRNFVWDPSTLSNISLSALYTETAEPLPLPPQHLLNDPII
jgi:hypothetical protein